MLNVLASKDTHYEVLVTVGPAQGGVSPLGKKRNKKKKKRKRGGGSYSLPRLGGGTSVQAAAKVAKTENTNKGLTGRDSAVACVQKKEGKRETNAVLDLTKAQDPMKTPKVNWRNQKIKEGGFESETSRSWVKGPLGPRPSKEKGKKPKDGGREG